MENRCENCKKNLVVGAHGVIGQALVNKFIADGTHVLVTSRKSGECSCNCLLLDLATDISAWEAPADISAAFLCAAVTSMGNCRNNPRQTRRVNVENTAVLAQKLAFKGAFNVFLSSNTVFDGSMPLQLPDSMQNPATEYGRQKADAERLLLTIDIPLAVVRLTKVITPGMPLFGNWIHSLKNNIPVHPFSDLKFSPIPLDWVINVLATVAEQRIAGIVQVSGKEDLSYEQAAAHIAKKIGADLSLIQPIKASESGVFLESIPVHTTLETSRLEHELGIIPPDIWQTIEKGCGYE